MFAHEKIAKILRTDKDVIRILEEKLSTATEKKGVMEKIAEENESILRERIELLGVGRKMMAEDIYKALLGKIEADDSRLFEVMGKPLASKPEDWKRVLATALKLAKYPEGFFLKKEKAAHLLISQPPRQVMKILGYNSAEKMIQGEDLFEIYAALRFIEGSDWLNDVFFGQYKDLKPSDFEKRPIETRSLDKKWIGLSERFVQKKHHNISHLKEIGLIFTLPLSLDIPGELMRNFSLILHYLNEIPFYSSLFEGFAADGKSFAKNIISLLRGDTLDERLPAGNKSQWFVIQRYLAKDDAHDWRLFEPHVNPEALHWERAERMLIKCGELFNHFADELRFWENLNWAGDYFQTETGIEVLVSFNLVDTAMSLVKEKELVKYLYHHQESLWNKIFSEYFGAEKMEELMKSNIIKGWFEI